MALSNTLRSLVLASLGCTLAGCAVGPNFVKPKPKTGAAAAS